MADALRSFVASAFGDNHLPVGVLLRQVEAKVAFASAATHHDERTDYAELAEQDHLLMLFYDEQLRHSLTKRVGGVDPQAVTEVLTNADRLLAAIPSGQRDFDRAKAEVMARTSL